MVEEKDGGCESDRRVTGQGEDDDDEMRQGYQRRDQKNPGLMMRGNRSSYIPLAMMGVSSVSTSAMLTFLVSS